MHSKWIVRTRYGFMRKATYCVRMSTALRVKRCMRSKQFFGQGMDFVRKATYASRSFLTLFDLAMTVLQIPNASSRCDEHSVEYLMTLWPSCFVAPEGLSEWCHVPSFCESWLPIGLSWFVGGSVAVKWCSVFFLARILTSDWAVLIHHPGGAFPVIVQWLNGSSLSDLQTRCCVFFRDNLFFWLGCTILRRDGASFSAMNLFFWLGRLIFRRNGASFPRRTILPIGSSGLQGSVACTISNNDAPFLIITYVTQWSKVTVHYALCRVCKM